VENGGGAASTESGNGAALKPESGQVRRFGSDAREMAALSTRLLVYNLGYLAVAWAIAFAAIAVFWTHSAWYTFIFAFLVVSSRQQALLNCEHECAHRKFVRGRRGNDLLGYLTGAPVGSPFDAARARHLAHHRLLATPEDPDRELHSGEAKQSRTGLARYFANGLLGGYAGMVLMGPAVARSPSASGTTRRDLVSLALSQAAIAVVLTLAFDWWVYPALWLAPLATLTALCHLVRSFVEHAITDSESEAHHNRLITIRSNRIERGLVAPYFMNYHAEHHLLPSVPAPKLKHVQERLADRSDKPPVLVRSSYGGAIRRYVSELTR
jgi:fatty acid desaturase